MKVVDALCYMDGVEKCLKQMSGGELNMVDAKDWMAVQMPLVDKKSDEIAVYYAYGDIVDRSDEWAEDVIDASVVCRDLKKLREDKNVKAVVVRINSGGGSAFASEQIWHELMLMKKEKPVVVSMGGMAASGAYYLSSAASYIYANPTTLTGSIGIFGIIPDASNLLQDKLGLNFDVVKTNDHADFGSLSRPFNPAEQQIMQNYVEQGYKLFIKRVAEGRKMSEEKVKNLADGRVWTGRQAITNGLADGIGDLDDAVLLAAQLSNAQGCPTQSYPTPKPWYELLLETRKSDYIHTRLSEQLGIYYHSLLFLKSINRQNYLQARIPYEPNIQN